MRIALVVLTGFTLLNSVELKQVLEIGRFCLQLTVSMLS